MSKDVFKKVGIGIGIAGLTLFPFLALAQGTVPGPLLTSTTQIDQLLKNVLSFLGTIVITISFIMLLYAAILYLTAGASETIHTKAKSVLIYAIVGVVIAVLAYSIVPFITYFFQTGGR